MKLFGLIKAIKGTVFTKKELPKDGSTFKLKAGDILYYRHTNYISPKEEYEKTLTFDRVLIVTNAVANVFVMYSNGVSTRIGEVKRDGTANLFGCGHWHPIQFIIGSLHNGSLKSGMAEFMYKYYKGE